MIADVELDLSPTGRRIAVNGQDITNAVALIAVTATPADSLPRITVELGGFLMPTIGQADINITPTAAQALISLGWTPPEGS